MRRKPLRRRVRQEVAEISITPGSGNVFADLGFDDAEEMFRRAQLVSRLDGAIRERKMTQKAAAELLGIKQPDLSALLHGHLRKYGLERLLEFVSVMGHTVKINIDPTLKYRPGGISITGSGIYRQQEQARCCSMGKAGQRAGVIYSHSNTRDDARKPAPVSSGRRAVRGR